MIHSLDLERNRQQVFKAGEGAGASGSFFFFSKDGKYIIKTLKRGEKDVFLNLIDDMIHHFRNHDSLIAKIYGIFTIKSNMFVPVDIILMESVVKSKEPSSFKICFDLKGSSVGRHLKLTKEQKQSFKKHLACTGTLKDINLLTI